MKNITKKTNPFIVKIILLVFFTGCASVPLPSPLSPCPKEDILIINHNNQKTLIDKGALDNDERWKILRELYEYEHGKREKRTTNY